jgi:hypothetical protein
MTAAAQPLASERNGHADPRWKFVAIFILGALTGIVGFLAWQRLERSDWNKRAITAEYDYVTVTGQENHIAFYYVLTNRTSKDYKLEQADSAILSKLERETSLNNKGEVLIATDYPIFVPAHDRLRISVEIPYAFPGGAIAFDTPKDVAEVQREHIEKYVSSVMSDLDGFEMFDSRNRIEIELPAGWKHK